MKETTNKINDKDGRLQVVGFHLDNEEFGIDIRNVREINKLSKITKVPNAPEFVEGLVNLRGAIVPLIQLRSRLGLCKKATDKDTRIVIVENGVRSIGLIVDSISKVLVVDQKNIENPPAIASGINSGYIKSIVKSEGSLLILLDINNLLSADERKILTKVN